MVRHKKHFITRGEVWFDGGQSADGADVVEYYHVPQPSHNCRCEDFYTIVFDLTKDEDSIFNEIRPEGRRQIRRAMESAELEYCSWFPAAPEPLEQFFVAYGRLAAEKRLSALDRALVQIYAEQSLLDLSCVRKVDGTPISWHANFRSSEQMRVIHSVTFFRGHTGDRNYIGRAHRWHMWRDMQRAKSASIPVFDLGGWYQGTEDAELLRVNAFKESFGGTVVRRFICERGTTLKGKLYLALRNVFHEGPLNAVGHNGSRGDISPSRVDTNAVGATLVPGLASPLEGNHG